MGHASRQCGASSYGRPVRRGIGPDATATLPHRHPSGPPRTPRAPPVGRWSRSTPMTHAQEDCPWQRPDEPQRPGAATCSSGRGTVTAATTGVFADLPTTLGVADRRAGGRDDARRSCSPRPTRRASRWPARTSWRRPARRRRALDVTVERHGRQARGRLDGPRRPRSRSAAACPGATPGVVRRRRPSRRRTAARSRGR